MKLLICGKGGSGKSTVAALLACAMQKRGKKVFLVDADESNIGLYRMLGLETPQPLMDSLGGKKGFRERTKTNAGLTLGGPPRLFPDNMTLNNLPKACVASLEGIKVMSVGKIHHFGEGCACPMGSLFRMLFSSLKVGKDDLVIVDTTAGVEHFGRSLDKQCDHILCVVDPSYESTVMAKKVCSLAKQAGLPVSVILNKVTPEIEADILKALEEVNIIGQVPNEHSIFINTLKGKALVPGKLQIDQICEAIEKAWI